MSGQSSQEKQGVQGRLNFPSTFPRLGQNKLGLIWHSDDPQNMSIILMGNLMFGLGIIKKITTFFFEI